MLGVLARSQGIPAALTASAAIYVIAAGVAALGRSRWDRPARA